MNNITSDMQVIHKNLSDALEAMASLNLPYDINSVFNDAVCGIISADYADKFTFDVESAVFKPDAALMHLPPLFRMAVVVAPTDCEYLPPSVANAYRCDEPSYVCAVVSDAFGNVPVTQAAQGVTINHAVLAALFRYFMYSTQPGGLRNAH